MFSRIQAAKIDDLYLDINKRSPKGVYFIRVASYSDTLKNEIWRLYQQACSSGVIIDERIQNPDEHQVSYLTEMIGSDFTPEIGFIIHKLSKWMPRMSETCAKSFAACLCELFSEQKSKGKPDSVLKNIYVKMMCWLYYKFERVIPQLGETTPPLIIYDGSQITRHELMFLQIMSKMGCDIVLLETKGDTDYLRTDPRSEYSQLLSVEVASPFPADFSLKALRKEMKAKSQNVSQPNTGTVLQSAISGGKNTVSSTAGRSSFPAKQVQTVPTSVVRHSAADILQSRFSKPSRLPCINAWMSEPTYKEILKAPETRGADKQFFYTALVRINGIEDITSYESNLFLFYQNLKNAGRNVLVLNSSPESPSPEEIAAIRRRNYRTVEECIIDLALNIPVAAKRELQECMQYGFMNVMLKASKAESNINKLSVIGVYLLCWLKRYYSSLFSGIKPGDIPCFILFGGCKNEKDRLFLDLLSNLPVDIFIPVPELSKPCLYTHESLLDISFSQSLNLNTYPTSGTGHLRTVASHAENELTGMLYTGTGIYKEKQFSKASSLILKTTYDEMFILLDQELKYRPNFSSKGDTVNMPVIFAKVCGVENGKLPEYWQRIKSLKSDVTYFANQFPILAPGIGNKYQQLAVRSLMNGRINRELIKNDRQYPFALLRNELQEHIFDKLQFMLDNRLIKGCFVNGTEYTVISTVLNTNSTLLRYIQSFDFTKKNPKLVCISTTDSLASLEDAIMISFLSLIGFDVIMFIPTGYQTIEPFLVGYSPVEHQTGQYIYDAVIPDLDSLPAPKSHSWLSIFSRRQ